MFGRTGLKGTVALVTGSTAGLGRVFAEALAAEGAEVVLNGRDQKRLEKAVEEFHAKGWAANSAAFDVTVSEDVWNAVRRVESEIGPIEILVNNAGLQYREPAENFPLSEWNRVIGTNLTGPFTVSQAVVQGMIKRRRGKIVNICSLQADLGRQTIVPYAASKGGLKMLTRAMCVEWAKYNIQVNAIGPGYFRTDMTAALQENEAFDQWLRARTPAGRWGEPEELVPALLLFVSEGSEFVNGQILYVDGGITASI